MTDLMKAAFTNFYEAASSPETCVDDVIEAIDAEGVGRPFSVVREDGDVVVV
jgi:hypothetical protein